MTCHCSTRTKVLQVAALLMGAACIFVGLSFTRPAAAAGEGEVNPLVEAAKLPPVAIPEAEAKTPGEMKKYTEKIVGTEVAFDMLPIPGGKFTMGSPSTEADRNEDEGPQREVTVAPFWMGKCEVTWDEYEQWGYSLEKKLREIEGIKPTPRDVLADAVTRPTKPYTDMTFGKGRDGCPAISMTGLAPRLYCEWLTVKTGRLYRLPTEAEWEYACRAGTTTAYSFGDDVSKIDEYAWYIENSNDKYQKVGTKKPNPWGLHDMHGNVMEWCLDQYFVDAYSKAGNDNPLMLQVKEYPQVARGGAWDGEALSCRSAAREKSDREWKVQDPQLPKSIWYLTDAKFVGFRVVRPFDPAHDKASQADTFAAKILADKSLRSGK